MTDFRRVFRWVGRSGKRIGVTIVGFGVLGAGIVMLVLPGPGILVVLVGLAILATEYAWARRALDVAKGRAKRAARRLRRRKKGPEAGS